MLPLNHTEIYKILLFATDAVLSEVEGEHRELRGGIVFFYLCELRVLCGSFFCLFWSWAIAEKIRVFLFPVGDQSTQITGEHTVFG